LKKRLKRESNVAQSEGHCAKELCLLFGLGCDSSKKEEGKGNAISDLQGLRTISPDDQGLLRTNAKWWI
jgi:hypothetical protein